MACATGFRDLEIKQDFPENKDITTFKYAEMNVLMELAS